MKRIIYSFVIFVLTISLLTQECAANNTPAAIQKQGSYSVQLDLKFSRKKQNALQRVVSILDYGPNAFATGFLVGDGLVMTAYHTVSGDLNNSKKAILGFAPEDQLEVKASVNGCEATVVMVDKDADIALLRICESQKRAVSPTFQANLNKDENILLVARPHGSKLVRKGVFFGLYPFQGLEFLSAKIDWRNGFSGSPVYNNKGEIVGVFSGYDGEKKLALISPGIRAQKLLQDYAAKPKP
jgi:hypothetical protein